MYDLTYKKKRIIALSDTHGKHRKVILPACDILIHLGDACEAGDELQLRDFFRWFSSQKSQYKVFVAGNHDLPFEFFPENAIKMIPENVLFMENNIIALDDLIIASVKAAPWMTDMIEIDEPIDILLSHGAPLGLLDDDTGCPHLKQLIEVCQPKYALFGHIHRETHASVYHKGTKCVNVCSITDFEQ